MSEVEKDQIITFFGSDMSLCKIGHELMLLFLRQAEDPIRLLSYSTYGDTLLTAAMTAFTDHDLRSFRAMVKDVLSLGLGDIDGADEEEVRESMRLFFDSNGDQRHQAVIGRELLRMYVCSSPENVRLMQCPQKYNVSFVEDIIANMTSDDLTCFRVMCSKIASFKSPPRYDNNNSAHI
jgi:hypothetical protein